MRSCTNSSPCSELTSSHPYASQLTPAFSSQPKFPCFPSIATNTPLSLNRHSALHPTDCAAPHTLTAASGVQQCCMGCLEGSTTGGQQLLGKPRALPSGAGRAQAYPHGALSMAQNERSQAEILWHDIVRPPVLFVPSPSLSPSLPPCPTLIRPALPNLIRCLLITILLLPGRIFDIDHCVCCTELSDQQHNNYHEHILSCRANYTMPVANVESLYEMGALHTYGPQVGSPAAHAAYGLKPTTRHLPPSPTLIFSSHRKRALPMPVLCCIPSW